MTERFNGTLQKLLLKLTGGEERKWSHHRADALYAYRITTGPTGLSRTAQCLARKCGCHVLQRGHGDEGDSLRAVREAQRYLEEFRANKRKKYRQKEPRGAKHPPLGAYATLRVISPRKGQTQWQPGYRVLSNHDGGMRIEDLETGHIIRVTQRNVRLLLEARDYDEIYPLPDKKEVLKTLPPNEAELITVGPNPYLPTTRGKWVK